MKTTARILSILLALVMVVGISTTAMAADYAIVENGQFVGVPANATDKVLVSADGDDADEIPDLVKGWYIYNSDDLTFAGRKTPAWDTFYGSQVMVKSISNWWGVNAGAKCETQSGGGKDEKGSYRDKDGFKFYSHLIHVGLSSSVNGHSVPLEHGIGVKPSKIDNPQENYVLVNVDGYNHFYAITGITGSAANQNMTNLPTEHGGSGTSGPDKNTAANTVIYEIWGSTKAIADTDTESKANDASFVKIASGEIGANNAGEFNVDVSAYKTLKLVTKVVGTKTQSNGGTECVWGEATLYNLPTDGSTPVTPPAPTGDVFTALPVALLVLSGAAIAVVLKKKEN
ncbi:MAG: hypothetical protein J6A88_06395 [Oscillospiraceae bacterium]|nr:hypothetical protein [Oscillospiraceae bacterium]